MILVLDVGNTNIKAGVFEGSELRHSFRIATDLSKTSDEYGILFHAWFKMHELREQDIQGVAVSSVVPSINYTLEHMVRYFFRTEPLIVGPGVKTGINIRYESPRDVGSDRIVNAVAAYELYGGPCITIDFGTATTFGAVSADGAFIGGAICPGMRVAAEALVQSSAKLPRIEFIKPAQVINRTTVSNMQSGIIYGFIGMVDYIASQMRRELRAPGAPVIATGGMSGMIAEGTGTISVINPTLTLEGLRLIYQRNNE